MGQRIGDYKSQLNQMQRAGTEQQPLGPDSKGKIGLREPLKPPTGWTKFKAALSNLPLLGKIGSLRQARAEVASYPVRLQQYQVQSREIMAGFMKSLRAEFGDSIANTAMHNVDQTGATPLTGRSVRTILANAEQAKKSMQTSNQVTLMRFLESPIQGGTGRMKGEQDMVGLMLDRGMKIPQDATSWKDFLGEKAGNFAQAYINKRLQEHPDYSKGRISNADIVQIAKDALDLVAEAQSHGLSPEQLEEVFAARGSDSQEMAVHLREFAVREALIDPALDRKNPDSMLRQAAQSIAKEKGISGFPDAVLKSIENSMREHVCFSFPHLHDDLKCAQDSSSIKQALAPVMKSKVEALLRDHAEALKMIDESTVLSEPQKTALREIASHRRMDPTQVKVYEKFASQMKNGLSEFKGAISSRESRVFAKSLLALKDTFEDGLTEMVETGEKNWESGSLRGGETTNEIMAEMMQVGLADLKQADRQELFKLLTSDDARSMLTAFRQSDDMSLGGQLPLVYNIMIERVGITSGMAPQEVKAAINKVGEDIPYSKLSPSEQLMATGADKTHYVDPKCKHREMVSKTFNGEALRAKYMEECRDFVNKSPLDANGLATAFNVDLNRAQFYVNGHKLPLPIDGNLKPAHDMFLREFTNKDGVVDMKLASLVSKCCNQRGVDNMLMAMEHEGLNGGELMGSSTTDNEAWQGEDGSWYVRVTSTLTADWFSDPKSTTTMPESIGGNGYMMASMTYKIPAESIQQGNPRVEVFDSRTFFSF